MTTEREKTTTTETVEVPEPVIEPDGPSTRVEVPEREVVTETETTTEADEPAEAPPG
jgi:hypothetical protein